MKIGAREIGGGAPCLVVAEVGLAHDGSLGMAHAYIDAVAAAGAGAVKFQRHVPAEGGEWRVKPPLWSPDVTREDYWRRTAFTQAQWMELRRHAELKGLLFLCSAFSVEAAQALEDLVPAWKVPSGQVTNGPLLEYMAAHPKPMIISTGMATEDELQELRYGFEERVMLQSTSLYPTPLDKVGLVTLAQAVLDEADAPDVEVGLSDHSGTIWPALAAATLGAAMVEVHVTFSRAAYGPDTASSITIAQLGTLCEGIEAIRKAQQPVDRAALLAGPLAEMRRIYMTKEETCQ